MRIMTSNIWGNFFNNPPALREDNLFKVYEKYNPDVIGFQEAACGWYDVDLFNKLSKKYHFVGTDLFENKNSTPVAVKKEYKILSYGFEQLENTPDDSKTITWAILEKDNKRFGICNTHFWWMRGGENEDLRKKLNVYEYTLKDHCALRSANAKQLAKLMVYLSDKYSAPLFAFGDMNATITEELFDVYKKMGIKNLFDMAEKRDTACSLHGDPVLGEDGRFHGSKATKEAIAKFRNIFKLPEEENQPGYFTSIDHIIGLGDNFKVTNYRVVEDSEALDATDHSPVFADIEY